MNEPKRENSAWRTPKAMLAAVCTAGALATIQPASAQDAGALVDKLVSKGILTAQEAEDVRTDMMKDFTQTSAGKINLSSSVTKLKLYGDFRYRWQYEDREPQVASTDHVSQRSRHRFRLTLAADVELTDHFFAGFALQTGQPSDGALQTFENGFDDYNIYISKAFLGWHNDWLELTAGKVKNPFYTTDLVWDPDITPNGVFEQIAFHKMSIFGGAGGPTGDAKDGKAMVEQKKVSPWELTLVAGQMIFDDNNEFAIDSDLSTDAYLFVEQLIGTYRFNKDTSVTVAPGFMTFTAADLSGLTRTNAFTDAAFIGSTTSTRTTTSTVLTTTDVTSAAGVTTRTIQPTTVTSNVTTVTNPNGTTTTSTGATTVRAGAAAPAVVIGNIGRAPNSSVTTANTVASAGVATPATPVGGIDAVSGETRQMHILTAPGDISFKLGGLKSKLYWDFAYNLTGKERYEDIYQLGGMGRKYESRDSLAWLVGFQLGEIKKKGDWSAYLNYRETGIASVDPNLNDGDFALGELNMRGFKLGLAYSLSDAVVFSVTGYMAWNMDKNLSGGRAANPAQNAPLGGAGVAESNAVNVVQVDLAVKF